MIGIQCTLFAIEILIFIIVYNVVDIKNILKDIRDNQKQLRKNEE